MREKSEAAVAVRTRSRASHVPGRLHHAQALTTECAALRAEVLRLSGAQAAMGEQLRTVTDSLSKMMTFSSPAWKRLPSTTIHSVDVDFPSLQVRGRAGLTRGGGPTRGGAQSAFVCGRFFDSPAWFSSGGAQWQLWVYPNGLVEAHKDRVGVFVYCVNNRDPATSVNINAVVSRVTPYAGVPL